MYGYNNPRATPPLPPSYNNNNNNWNNPSSSPSSPRVTPPMMGGMNMGMGNMDLNSGMGMGMGMNNNMGMGMNNGMGMGMGMGMGGGMGGGMGMPMRPSQYQAPAVNKPYQNNYSDNLDANSANLKNVNVNVNVNYNQQGMGMGMYDNNNNGYNPDLEMKKMASRQASPSTTAMTSLAYRTTAFAQPAIPGARGDTQFDGVAPETFNGMEKNAFSGAGMYKSGEYEEHASAGAQYFRDAILGVNDGLVSILLLTLGLSGGNLTNTQILIAGITGAMAGAISMALGEYIATKSQAQVMAAEMALEKQHLAFHRETELAEVRTFMQELNLEGDLLDKCVQAINQRDEAMIRLMMSFEFGFQEELERNPVKAMLTSGCLFITGSLPAFLPYAVTANNTTALAISISLSAVALFGIGAGKTKLTKGPWLYDGMENLILGSIGGAATFGLGKAYGSGTKMA